MVRMTLEKLGHDPSGMRADGSVLRIRAVLRNGEEAIVILIVA